MKLLLLTAVMALSTMSPADSAEVATARDTVVFTLQDAIKVALSANVSVLVADKEIMRTKYAHRGTYAALFPQVDLSGSYQRTLKKQVMYMDAPGMPADGLEIGRFNTWSGAVNASMPIINSALWQSVRISADEVELAVEKARGSRIDVVTEVKNAFYAVLMAKETYKVYEKVLDNAKVNLDITQSKYDSQKASEMDLLRAKTSYANAVPDYYNASNMIELSLWQLKAVMGIDLDTKIDVEGCLGDYAQQMFYDIHEHDALDMSGNSSLKQLDIQVEELRKSVVANGLAYVPTLSVAFSYSYNAMENNFNFSEYKWTPHSYVGLSLQIPIFSGLKRLNNVKVSKANLANAQLQRTNTERQLKIAAKSELNTMETQMKTYVAAQAATESAQKGFDISRASYEVGRSTLVELNDAMLALANAEMSQWSAVYKFLTSKSNLEKQLGLTYTE